MTRNLERIKMRKEFAIQLYKQMVKNPNIVVITGDLGYKMWDKIRYAFPDRFINVGASEFTMVGIACGLALEGKIPFVYTITPFYYRAFEMIRTYVNHENIHVNLVGSGRDKDYAHDGFSHEATDFNDIFGHLGNINQFFPLDLKEVESILEKMISNKEPNFISLKR